MGKKNLQVKHLWGQGFTIVNDGLDETEVSSFIGQLMQQNKEYAERQEHLNSLRMLAEKTVIEAENQAQHDMVESQEKANRAAEATIKEAEAKAREEANGIIIEAQEKAKADANTIISEATKEAERLQQKAQAILAEMEETARLKLAQAEQQASEILGTARTEADNLKTAAHATADSMISEAQKEVDNTMTRAKEDASEIRKQAARELQIAKRKMAQVFINSQNTAERQIKDTITRIYEGALSVLETEGTTDTSLLAEEAGKTPAATLEDANHSTIIADSPKEELGKAPESELEASTREYQAEPMTDKPPELAEAVAEAERIAKQAKHKPKKAKRSRAKEPVPVA
jgi:vacuolar-type H+-ATPase subunit H